MDEFLYMGLGLPSKLQDCTKELLWVSRKWGNTKQLTNGWCTSMIPDWLCLCDAVCITRDWCNLPLCCGAVQILWACLDSDVKHRLALTLIQLYTVSIFTTHNTHNHECIHTER